MSKKVPIRSCLVCRKRSEKHELLRVVFRDGRLVRDAAQREPGRGAYVHARPECAARAGSVKLWEKALKTEGGALRAEAVEEFARQLLVECRDERQTPSAAESAGKGGKRGKRVRL